MSEEELDYGFYMAYNACMFFVEDFHKTEKKEEILETEE